MQDRYLFEIFRKDLSNLSSALLETINEVRKIQTDGHAFLYEKYPKESTLKYPDERVRYVLDEYSLMFNRIGGVPNLIAKIEITLASMEKNIDRFEKGGVEKKRDNIGEKGEGTGKTEELTDKSGKGLDDNTIESAMATLMSGKSMGRTGTVVIMNEFRDKRNTIWKPDEELLKKWSPEQINFSRRAG